ncbi:MAG: hypothetical protein ACREK5_09620 [Gemmatimonadota bacterium]
MFSILKVLSPVLLLSVVLACEEDDLGFTGEFNLTIVETSDTCDGIEDTFFSRVEISGTTDGLEVRFGEEALLTGGLNSQNFFEVSGPAMVVIDETEIVSSMVLIFEVSGGGRRLEVRDGSMLTFEGTHPAAPGEVCVQQFLGTGQRLSLSRVI